MRKEQIWCDNCGAEIQLKNVPTGSNDFSNSDKSWELWSPKEDDGDFVLCSLQCVIEKADDLMTEEMQKEENNENS